MLIHAGHRRGEKPGRAGGAEDVKLQQQRRGEEKECEMPVQQFGGGGGAWFHHRFRVVISYSPGNLATSGELSIGKQLTFQKKMVYL